MPGILYLVATPIGNLQDITIRALETLRSADVIACEDTRHTGKLLRHFEISKKLISYHEHNENSRADDLLEILGEGRSVALVSDAGTPAINDPGYVLVQKAADRGVSVVPIPGAVAFVNAAIVSGLPTDSIFFGGFLPSKTSDRRRRLSEVSQIAATLAFYEAPHRLARSLADCAEMLGDRKAAIVRELTKVHEETDRGGLAALAVKYSNANIKGEIVLVIDRCREERVPTDPNEILSRVRQLEGEGRDRKAALKIAAKEFGLARSEAYRLFQAQKNAGIP
jgi:16S rRNA (cytidine1402-2'-O)-methyltransferase